MRTLPLVLGLLLVPGAVPAQSLLLTPPGSSVSFEVLHPTFEDGEGISILSGAYYLGGRFQIREGFGIVAELPFAYFDADSELGELDSSKSVGNPLIGVVYQAGITELGLAARVPLASDDEFAGLFAVTADPYRLEAFVPDLLTFQGTARVAEMVSEVARLGFNFGAALVTSTEGGDPELLVDYGGNAAYVGQVVRAGVGLNGRTFATSGGDLADSSFYQASLFGDFGSGALRPGLSVRFPLDDDTSELLDMTFGLSLQYLLP